MAKARRIARMAAVAGLAAVGLAAAAIATGYGLLQTDSGRRAASAWIASAISTPGQAEIKISGLKGALPGRVRISEFSVSDSTGAWFLAEDLAIDWRPLALLSGKVSIDLLAARRVRMLRLPPESASGPDAGDSLSPLLTRIRIAKLSAESVDLAPSVLGVAAAVRAEGSFAVRDGARVVSSVTLIRVDGAKGHVRASASYGLGDETLALDVSVVEPAGGLAARILDLPGLPAVAIDISGAGPVKNWRGEAKLSVDGLASMDAELSVSGGRPYLISAKGKALAGKGVDPDIRNLVSPVLSFDVALGWMPGETRLVLRRGRFASRVLSLAADGAMDTQALTVKASAELKVLQAASLARYTAPFSAAGASLSASVDGRIGRPGVKATVSVSGLRGPGFAAPAGEFRLIASPLAGARWTVDAEVKLDRARFEDSAVAALAGKGGSARLVGKIDERTGVVEGATLRAVLGNLTVAGAGRGNIKSQQGSAELELTVGSLAPMSPVVDIPIAGRVDWSGKIAGDASGLTVGLTGKARDFSIGEPTLDAFLGTTPALSAAVRVERADTVRITDVVLRGQHTRLTMESRIAAPWRTMNGSYRLQVDDLARVAKSLDLSATGRLTSEGTLDGPPDNPVLDGRFTARSVIAEGLSLGILSGRYTIATPFSRPTGAVSVVADTPAGKVEASSNLRLIAADRLRLAKLSLRADGASIDGDITVSTKTGIASGRLTGKVRSLARATRKVPLSAAGSFGIDLNLRPKGDLQAAALKFSGRNLVVGQAVRLGAVKGTLDAIGLGRAARLSLDVRASKAVPGAGMLESVTLSASGGIGGFDMRVAAKGDVHGPLDMVAEATVRLEGGHPRIALNRADGRLWGLPIALNEPGVLAIGEEGYELSLSGLSWGKGRISASARADRRSVTGSLSAKQIAASLIAPLFPGLKASGAIGLEARLSGLSSSPEGEARLDLTEIKLSDSADLELPTLSGSVSGQLRGGRLTVDGKVSGIGDTAIRARGDVPLRFDAAALTVRIPRDEAARGDIEWNGDLAGVSPLLPLPNHLFSGVAAIALGVSGTIGSPALKGKIDWPDGGYENIVTGTILRNIRLSADADGTRVVLRRAVAEDGDGGRLTAEGSIRTGQNDGPVFDLRAELSKFSLIRQDTLTARASGRLALNGNARNTVAQGQLEVDRIEAYIVESLPPELTELDVEEINDGADGVERRKVRKRQSTHPIRLDIALAAPRRVFLRGRGLESEWAGALRVAGTAAAPVVSGKLKPVRGQFELAGKVFKLGQGSVTFEGGEKIDPTLDIAAEHSAKDVKATVRVTGTASRPKVTLSSVPTLPQDEILARVLFGKSVGRLTAGEGVQLASAMASLTGLDGGGPGIFDRVRNTLGVDTLRVGNKENGETTVGVGKYVTKDVYVGVDQGATQGSGNVTVEVTVTPNVTVKSDIGADARSRVGINWKWDY